MVPSSPLNVRNPDGAAVLARRAPRPWSGRSALAAVLGAVVVPLALMVAAGAAQSEVHVVEHSGDLLLNSGRPYVPHPAGVDDYNLYLPGMALFGIAHALFGGTAFADARVWFCAVFLVSMLVAGWRSGRNSPGPGGGSGGRAVVLPAAFPAVALPLVVGGVDLPVIGLMCLGLALAGRGGTGTAAGPAMGAAAALKWTAWPLLPVGLVLLAVTAGRRAAVRAGVVAVLVAASAVVPAALADPHAFVEHVVLFPLGEAGCALLWRARCPGICWRRTCPAVPPSPWPRSWPPPAVWGCRWRYGRPGPFSRRRTGWRSGWGWRCA